MSRTAPSTNLNEQERKTLESWVRSPKTEQRMVFRARIVLLAAAGRQSKDIARELQTRPATVSKWRKRFADQRIAGLQDAPRPGKKRQYGLPTERRLLDKLSEPPPTGYATWSGPLLARALGDVPVHQVWRILRKHNIQLQRRRSWCVSTDPEFAAKAADIVGLYLDPPENALVLCVDEKPSIQALDRAQGYLRLPNGRALCGYSHDYKRNGTTTLLAALDVATGQVQAGHYNRRRRREFLDFMNEVVAAHSGREIHVILDNLRTHKPKDDRWLQRHKNVRFHFTPTHASWLNMIEVWFSILSRRALKGASFSSVRELREGISRFIKVYNETAAPFEWTKREVFQKPLKHNFGDLRK